MWSLAAKYVKSKIAPFTGVASGNTIIALFGTAAAGTESTSAISMYSPASSLAPGTTDEAFSTAFRIAPGAMSYTGKAKAAAALTGAVAKEEEVDMIKRTRNTRLAQRIL